VKIGFNEATTLKNSTLESDLYLCNEVGFDYIEIRIDKIKEYLESHKMEELVNFFNTNRLKPFAFNALEGINFRSREQHEELLKELNYLCNLGTTIGCSTIVVVPSFDVGYRTVTEIKDNTVSVLEELASITQKYGMRLALEFVGYPNCCINTLSQAYDIVASLDRPDVGIVLDCFHLHAMNSRVEDIYSLDPEKLFIVHLDDAEELPPGILRDEHRVWPGDGVARLGEIFKALKTIGFDGIVSVEIFRPEYWQWEPSETVRVAKEKAEAVLKRYWGDEG